MRTERDGLAGEPLGVERTPVEKRVVAVELPDNLWTNRRILTLLALSTLIVSVIWHAPLALGYVADKAHEIFIAFVLATGFTYVLRPIVNALNRTPYFGAGSHWGRVWATLAVFMGGTLLVYILALFALRPITADIKEFWTSFLPPTSQGTLYERYMEAINGLIASVLQSVPPEVESQVKKFIPDMLARVQERAKDFASHASFLVELVLVPVLVFYFLTDGPKIRAEAKLLVPVEWRPRLSRIANSLDWVLDGFIRGQVIMCLIAWVLVTTVLWALRVPHAFTLGLLAGLTRAVPVIGPLLGGAPVVVVCQIATGDWQKTAVLAIFFTAMHFLESKVLMPKIVGHHVDLHPVSVIFAILVGMEFFGFIGVLLAVPIAALAKILLTEWHDARRAHAAAHGAAYDAPHGASGHAPGPDCGATTAMELETLETLERVVAR